MMESNYNPDTGEIAFVVGKSQEGMRLSSFLRQKGVSVALLRSVKYTERGLQINGSQARTNRCVCEGDTVILSLPPEANSVEPEDMLLDIVYEDNHCIVFNKPAGMIVHPTGKYNTGTLAHGFTALMKSRGCCSAFRPIGRLDKDTSGLMLCAKNAYAAPLLSQSSQKVYLAITEGAGLTPNGIISLHLEPQSAASVQQKAGISGKASETAYEVIASGDRGALVIVKPKTGRTHQIRAHFSAVGHPLAGDSLYGGNTDLLGRQALHRVALSFVQPLTKKVIYLYATMPKDMQCAMQTAGIDIPTEEVIKHSL